MLFFSFSTADDGKLMADADTGEFWGFFGGFAPLPKKSTIDESKNTDAVPSKLFRYLISSTSCIIFLIHLYDCFTIPLCSFHS